MSVISLGAILAAVTGVAMAQVADARAVVVEKVRPYVAAGAQYPASIHWTCSSPNYFLDLRDLDFFPAFFTDFFNAFFEAAFFFAGALFAALAAVFLLARLVPRGGAGAGGAAAGSAIGSSSGAPSPLIHPFDILHSLLSALPVSL